MRLLRPRFAAPLVFIAALLAFLPCLANGFVAYDDLGYVVENPVVRAVAEMLGLDPMHVANEGKAVLGVRGDDATVQAVLDALRRHPTGVNAAVIGECVDTRVGDVVLDTGLGKRLLSEYEGELLPRIC